MTRIGLINAEGITRGHSEASCSNDAATLGPSASAWDHGGRGERGRQALLRVRVEGLESGGYEVCARRGRVCRGAARWWLGWVRKSALVRVARCGRQHGGLRRGPAVAGRAAGRRCAPTAAASTRLLAEHLPPVVRWQPEDVQATYLVRLDCSPLGLDDPAGLFERRGRVAFEPGSLFGPTLAVATPHAPLLLLVPAGLVDSRHTAASLVLPNGQSNGKSDGGDWSDRTRRASAGSGVLALSCALTRSAWPGGVATRRDLRTGCRADIRGAARRRRRFGRGRPSRDHGRGGDTARRRHYREGLGRSRTGTTPSWPARLARCDRSASGRSAHSGSRPDEVRRELAGVSLVAVVLGQPLTADEERSLGRGGCWSRRPASCLPCVADVGPSRESRRRSWCERSRRRCRGSQLPRGHRIAGAVAARAGGRRRSPLRAEEFVECGRWHARRSGSGTGPGRIGRESQRAGCPAGCSGGDRRAGRRGRPAPLAATTLEARLDGVLHRLVRVRQVDAGPRAGRRCWS